MNKEKFNELISVISNEFIGNKLKNLSYYKENNLKFHSFQLNPINFIELGKLVYNNEDVIDWTDDEEDNALINKEINELKDYGDDINSLIQLGYNVASIIIKNPKFDKALIIDSCIVYMIPTYQEVYDNYTNEIKEYIIKEKGISETYYNKAIKDDETREAFIYVYVVDVLIKL